MIKKVYWNGKLIPVKDWDFDKKRPKVKEKKAVVTEPETQVEVIAEESAKIEVQQEPTE